MNSCCFWSGHLHDGAGKEMHRTRQFCPVFKWPISSFPSPQQMPFPIFLWYQRYSLSSPVVKTVLCKVRLVVRWNMLCDASALDSVVICRVVPSVAAECAFYSPFTLLVNQPFLTRMVLIAWSFFSDLPLSKHLKCFWTRNPERVVISEILAPPLLGPTVLSRSK